MPDGSYRRVVLEIRDKNFSIIRSNNQQRSEGNTWQTRGWLAGQRAGRAGAWYSSVSARTGRTVLLSKDQELELRIDRRAMLIMARMGRKIGGAEHLQYASMNLPWHTEYTRCFSSPSVLLSLFPVILFGFPVY